MKKPIKSSKVGCSRAPQVSNWRISESWSDPRFGCQIQCNLVVWTLLLGLGFRVCFFYWAYLFFKCSCNYKYKTLFIYMSPLALSSISFFCIFIFVTIKWFDVDPTMSPVKVVRPRCWLRTTSKSSRGGTKWGLRTSPGFEENGGARRKGGEATLRRDSGSEFRHWWREKRRSRLALVCP